MPDQSQAVQEIKPARRRQVKNPESNAPKFRIDNGTAFLMIGIALIYDLISLIPFVNDFSEIFAALHFWLWFQLRGVSIFKSKNILAVQIVTVIIEFIPIVSMLPAVAFATWRTITISKVEDKLNHSKLLGSVAKKKG